jgi:hypothetical protein
MDSGGETIGFPVNVLAGQWTQVVVPLSAIGSPSTVKRINIKDNSGGSQPTFYVDELCLSNSTPPPPPTGCDLPVYLEALAPSWQNWSWDGTYNFAETGPGLRRQLLNRRDDHQHYLWRAVGAAQHRYHCWLIHVRGLLDKWRRHRERRPPAPGTRLGQR